jgi:hypothetical protein
LLLVAAVVAGLAAWGLAQAVAWPPGLVGRLLQTGIGTALAFALYGLLGGLAGVPEVRQLLAMARRRPARVG